MEKDISNKLVDELEKHSGIIYPDKEIFMDLLMSTELHESTKFYERLPENQHMLNEFDSCYCLSLRRILRNKNVMNHQLTGFKLAYETMTSILGVYSSDVLSRKVRKDKDLVNMMLESKHPYSLLAKFQTYDFDNPDQTFIITKPILIIPDATDTTKISEWEISNTTYEKEVGNLFKYSKRIKPQEYLI